MWEAITSTITNIISLVGTTTTSLLNNSIFQITIGVIFLIIIIGVIFRMVSNVGKRKKSSNPLKNFDFSVAEPKLPTKMEKFKTRNWKLEYDGWDKADWVNKKTNKRYSSSTFHPIRKYRKKLNK